MAVMMTSQVDENQARSADRKMSADQSTLEVDSEENRAVSPLGSEPGSHISEVSAEDLTLRQSESTRVEEHPSAEDGSASPDAAKKQDQEIVSEHAKKAWNGDAEADSTADNQVNGESASRLLNLPSELLQHIFELVGPHYFRADVGRLAVCKQWLPMAQTILFQELRLTPRMLERLFERSSTKIPVDVVKCAYLDLHGYWGVVRPTGTQVPTSQEWDEQRKARRKWVEDLNRNMGKLRPLLKTCPNLFGLSIQCRSEHRPNAPKNGAAAKESLRQYLDAEKLLSLWQLQSLTVLELDLSCMRSPLKVPYFSGKADPAHLCPRIAPLLRQLVSLTIRAVELCSEVLLVPDAEINPKLRTIFIELGRMISDKDGPSQWKNVSVCANSQIWSPTDDFRGKLQLRLEQIARAVESPQRMWLIYVVPGDKSIVKEAYDAVHQKTLALGYESRTWEIKTESNPKE